MKESRYDPTPVQERGPVHPCGLGFFCHCLERARSAGPQPTVARDSRRPVVLHPVGNDPGRHRAGGDGQRPSLPDTKSGTHSSEAPPPTQPATTPHRTDAPPERETTGSASEPLCDIEGLTLYGPPPSRRAGVISFALEGIHPHDLATIADRDQVCLRAGHHCAMPLMTRLGVAATARASFYVYTQKDEVDRLVGSIKEAQRIFK